MTLRLLIPSFPPPNSLPLIPPDNFGWTPPTANPVGGKNREPGAHTPDVACGAAYHHPVYPSFPNRESAKNAWLCRGVQSGPFESSAGNCADGRLDCEQLGVGKRALPVRHFFGGLSQDGSVNHDDRANGRVSFH